MRNAFSSLVAMVGLVLVSALVATTLMVLGLNPLLGVVAGAVVALDVLFYRRESRVDTAGALEELADRTRSPGR